MFDWLKSFFAKADAAIKQTGLIVVPPAATDWNKNETGIVGVVRMPTRDWSPFVSPGERQWTIAGFDSMSCASFSTLNVLETMINQVMPTLPEDHKTFLKKFGMLDENGFANFSDNFTSVMSKTDPRTGNSFPSVADSIRNLGVIAEKDLPFTATTIKEFFDASRISSVMKNRALKFKQYFDFKYQWVHFNTTGAPNTPTEITEMQDALLESPLAIGIVIPASHAEELLQYDSGQKTFMNSYEPFLMKFDAAQDPIHFSMKYSVTPKTNVPKFPAQTAPFISHLSLGSSGPEVKALQDLLCYLGFMSVSTGYFGPITQQAVKDFQTYYKIDSLGEVGPATRTQLNAFLK